LPWSPIQFDFLFKFRGIVLAKVLLELRFLTQGMPVKTLAFKVMVLVTGVATASFALAAETPLKLGSELIRIEGASRASTTVSALVYYTPLYKFDMSVSSAGCTFPEDHWKPNENDMSVTIKAQSLSAKGYSLQIPTQGLRGTCAYVLESLYFYIEDKAGHAKVSETINILSERQVARMNEDMTGVGGMDPVKSLTELSGLYCEYQSEFEYGFCSPAQDTIASFYGVSNSAATYTLDVKDISERPERQY
jgi:hypothetical protein